MKIINLFTLSLFISLIAYTQKKESNNLVIAEGHMPNMAKDKGNNIHIVYGNGDSILYVSSKDGKSFTSSSLVAVLPKLFASAMRGPQIAAAYNGLVITACTNTGNIFSYTKEASGKWTKGVRINDVSEVAKEALMALSADGLNAYAVWLGVKSQKGQNVYGAKSVDGGKTWSKNILVYASPDGTVCECCKPSVAVKGNNVYVMFRNWLNGNRDLYLIRSTNGGGTFGQAEKLGFASWPLKGCPMDGGSIVVDDNGNPKTVWNRQGIIYACDPGKQERAIGKGRNCTLETLNGREVYAWVEDKEVFIGELEGKKQLLGPGKLPVIKAIGNNKIICLWETEGKIHKSIFYL